MTTEDHWPPLGEADPETRGRLASRPTLRAEGPLSAQAAALARLAARSVRDPVTRCRVWQGARQSKGYGNVRYQGHHFLVHRLAYQLLVGPIPEGHELDHLCRRHECWEPTHLQPVPPEVNLHREAAARRREHQ